MHVHMYACTYVHACVYVSLSEHLFVRLGCMYACLCLSLSVSLSLSLSESACMSVCMSVHIYEGMQGGTYVNVVCKACNV